MIAEQTVQQVKKLARPEAEYPGFVKKLLNPWTFRSFLLMKLPLGFFSGMRVKSLDTQHCSATIPYGWMTRNPFKSTYFAALAMAAELSNGTLALMAVYKRKPSVAVIITGTRAEFIKKAVNTVTFTCKDGEKLFSAVDECILTGEGREVEVMTSGVSEDGIEVARFYFTWSFKARN